MRKSVKSSLIVLSVAMNVAFVAVWLVLAASHHHESSRAGVEPEAETNVWCPLHRALRVDRQQWQEIEPRLTEFQTSVGQRCQRVRQLRSEVLELIASGEPDLAAIRTRQDDILATKREIQQLVVGQLQREKGILTADQQKQLFQMLRDRTGHPGPPMSGQSFGIGVGKVLQGGEEN